MRVVPDISWVPTVSCDVPPMEVLVVVVVVVGVVLVDEVVEVEDVVDVPVVVDVVVPVVVVAVVVVVLIGDGSTSYASPPYALAGLEAITEPLES